MFDDAHEYILSGDEDSINDLQSSFISLDKEKINERRFKRQKNKIIKKHN